MWLYVPRAISAPSRASERSTLLSDECSQTLARSATWKTKQRASSDWQRIWKQDASIRRLFGATFARSEQENSEAVLTWWSEAFPARTCPTPASEPAFTARGAGCSSISSAPFATYDPDTCSWKTSARSLWGDLTPFSGRWPKSGSLLDGAVYERPTLARLMAAIGGGVSPGTADRWPTPAAMNPNDGESPATWRARAETLKAKHGNGNGAGVPLAIAAQESVQNWATPAASPWRQGDASDETMARNSRPLNEQASHWQTPSVADTTGGHLSRGGDRSEELLLKGQAQQVAISLSGPQAQPIAGRGKPFSLGGRTLRPQLSALFVEWLMGVPLGMTCVCVIEEIVFGDSAMQLSRSAPRLPSVCSGGTPSVSGCEAAS